MAYIPPLNGGRLNASVGGNSTSAGAGYAMLSTGTMLLAGGNNITLSQNGQNITISGGNAGGSNTFGMSNLGNTSGTTGVISGSAGQLLFAGGNNVTLSQSINGSSATITVSAASQSVQTQNLMTVNGTQGNVSISGGANVTVGNNASTITISAANQSVQTQNLFNLTLSGNSTSAGAGFIQVSSGTLTLAGGNNITLSQNGNAVSIIGGAGAGGGIALANSQTTYTSGTANLVEGGGAITIASTTGQSFKVSVPATSSLSATGALSISSNASTISIGVPAFSAGISNIGNTLGTSGTASNQVVFVGGNNVTLSQSTAAGGNTITISAGGLPTLSRWEYPDDVFASIGTVPNGSLSIQHMYVPFNVSGSAAKIGGSFSASTNGLSGAATASISLWMGIYTLNGSTLSLASSGSTNNSVTWNGSAAGGVTGISGMRELTVPMNVNMTPGEYWVGAGVSSSVNAGAATISLYGNNMVTNGGSNAICSPLGNSTLSRGAILFEGIYFLPASSGPSSMASGSINNTGASNVQRANFYNAIYNAIY